jgi:hypothetical protein
VPDERLERGVERLGIGGARIGARDFVEERARDGASETASASSTRSSPGESGARRRSIASVTVPGKGIFASVSRLLMMSAPA